MISNEFQKEFTCPKIQMHFQSNCLIVLLNVFDRCINLCKFFKNEIYLFSFGLSMKKIIPIKVG